MRINPQWSEMHVKKGKLKASLFKLLLDIQTNKYRAGYCKD